MNRKESYKVQVKSAEEMIKKSKTIFKEIETGKYVTVVIPKIDRVPLDKKNLEGIIVEKKNSMYRIDTKRNI